MITVIAGNVAFLQERALQRLKLSWGDCDCQSFFGPEATAGEILRACQTLSLWNLSSGAVVRHAESLPKKEQETLLGEIERLAGDVRLALVADKIDKRLKFWQTLLRQAEVLSADAPAGKSIRPWFQKELEMRQRRFDADALEQIVMVAHENFVEAVWILERACLYRGPEETIQGVDVAACLVGGEAAHIFDWSEAVGAGQWKQAFSLLQGLWAHHEEPLALLAVLLRHFRILFKARENESLWGRSGDLARILAVPPFVVDKYCQQSKRYRRRHLWQIWNELLETDRQLKSSPVPRELILENLVWRLKAISTKVI